jgi:hypothetical protein
MQKIFLNLFYEGRSEINASYFVMLEDDVDPIAVQVETSANILLSFVAVRQMAAEGQIDKMVSDMEVHMKQRCVTELLHAEKFGPNYIHRRLLNVYGDQIVGVSTVR